MKHRVLLVLLYNLLFVPTIWGMDWWPRKHFLTSMRTESYPANTAPPVTVWRQPQLDWDIVVRWYNEDKAGLRPFLGHIFIEDDQGHVINQMNFERPIFRIFECQADTDAALELCITYKDSSLVGARLLDWPNFRPIGHDVVFAEEDYKWRGNSYWDTWFFPGPLVPRAGIADGAGLPYRLMAGWAHMPRGIMMIDASTGNEMWHKWSGAPPDNLVVAHDAENNPILLWAAGSPGTGSYSEHEADTCAYLFALDATGHELWRREYPVPFTSVTTTRVSSAKTGKTLAAELVSSHTSGKQPSLLRLFDPKSGQVIKEREIIVPSGRGYLAGVDDANGSTRLIVTTHESPLVVYDENLDSLWATDSSVSFFDAWDVDGDRVFDIPVATSDGSVQVYALNGQLLMNESVPGKVKAFQRVRNAEIARLWTYSETTCTGYNIAENKYYALQLILASSGYVLGFTFILGLTFWSIRTRRAYVRTRREKLVLEGWTQVASFQAHDTKKPIAVIQRALDNFEITLQRKHPDVNGAHFFERVRGELSRMLQTARQIQVVSRTTKPDLQEIDINQLIAATVVRMNELESTLVVHEGASHHVRVQCDYRLIESMLENLIGNAMEATTNGNAVRISACQANGDAGGIRVKVSDSGAGMSTDTIHSILDGKGSRKPGGQGLGILSAKWIAETHGGSLTIESEFGKGTTITVALPDPGGESSHAKTSS